MRPSDLLVIAMAMVVAAGCLVGFEDYPVETSDAGSSGGAGGAGGSAGFNGSGAGGAGGASGAAGLGFGGSAGCADGGGGCGPMTVGAPLPPAGWIGPGVFTTGSRAAAPACPVGYVGAALAHSVPVIPTTCECACDGGPSCSASLEYFGKAACATPTGSSGALAVGCNEVSIEDLVTARLTVGAACAPPTVSSEAPPTAYFSQDHQICLPAETPSCDTGLACLPDVGETACIFREGMTSCPEGPYSSAQTVFGSLSDARTCVGCSCNGSCAASLALHSITKCGASLPGTCTGNSMSPPGCCAPFGVPTNVHSVDVQFLGNLATCAASTPTISGDVQLEQPLTVCCMP